MKVIEQLNDRKRVYTDNKQPSKTDQQYKDDTDVNYILNKYAKTGQLSHVNQVRGQYADVSEIPDLHSALQKVKLADEAFMQLSSAIRKRFNNQPAVMVEFLQDPKNNEEAIKLGLKVSPPAPEKVIIPPTKELNNAEPKSNANPEIS